MAATQSEHLIAYTIILPFNVNFLINLKKALFLLAASRGNIPEIYVRGAIKWHENVFNDQKTMLFSFPSGIRFELLKLLKGHTALSFFHDDRVML